MLTNTDRIARDVPVSTPADMAEAALYLVSEQSGWINGVVLDVAVM